MNPIEPERAGGSRTKNRERLSTCSLVTLAQLALSLFFLSSDFPRERGSKNIRQVLMGWALPRPFALWVVMTSKAQTNLCEIISLF